MSAAHAAVIIGWSVAACARPNVPATVVHAVRGVVYGSVDVVRKVEKRNVGYRLTVDLIRMIETEAIAEGRDRESGRAFNPSAVVERVLRAYFDAKKPRRAK